MSLLHSQSALRAHSSNHRSTANCNSSSSLRARHAAFTGTNVRRSVVVKASDEVGHGQVVATVVLWWQQQCSSIEGACDCSIQNQLQSLRMLSRKMYVQRYFRKRPVVAALFEWVKSMPAGQAVVHCVYLLVNITSQPACKCCICCFQPSAESIAAQSSNRGNSCAHTATCWVGAACNSATSSTNRTPATCVLAVRL